MTKLASFVVIHMTRLHSNMYLIIYVITLEFTPSAWKERASSYSLYTREREGCVLSIRRERDLMPLSVSFQPTHLPECTQSLPAKSNQ